MPTNSADRNHQAAEAMRRRQALWAISPQRIRTSCERPPRFAVPLTRLRRRPLRRQPYEFITGPLLREPYRVGKRLLPPMGDRFSARRGTYRIICRIDDKNRVVTVVDVDHRRDVYRS